ncbi:hypothetical protein CR513_35404, partial [Mucuna pruriens]
MYEVVRRDLGVTLLFQPFEADVWLPLNFTPAVGLPFKLSLYIIPIAPLFLYHFVAQPYQKATRVLLTPYSERCLFDDYLILDGHFKSRFVKIKSPGRFPFTTNTRAFS